MLLQEVSGKIIYIQSMLKRHLHTKINVRYIHIYDQLLNLLVEQYNLLFKEDYLIIYHSTVQCLKISFYHVQETIN